MMEKNDEIFYTQNLLNENVLFQECLCPGDLKSQFLKTLSETVY